MSDKPIITVKNIGASEPGGETRFQITSDWGDGKVRPGLIWSETLIKEVADAIYAALGISAPQGKVWVPVGVEEIAPGVIHTSNGGDPHRMLVDENRRQVVAIPTGYALCRLVTSAQES